MKNIINENIQWIDKVWNNLDDKLRVVARRSFDKLPYTSVNGVHDNKHDTEPDWWTNGFWGGMMWLMYAETGNEVYKMTAMRSEELIGDALKDFKKLHHDVGFMWHILSGANYRLTGNTRSCNLNLYMAAMLFSRFNVDGDYIRAWNVCPELAGWTIIDCMMNIPLLYWASEEIGDDRFKKIAMRHADMAMRDHIRSDGSVNHIVEHNPETGEVIKVHSGQGYSETSCWTRGSAWAIYGFVLSYIHTCKIDYLNTARKAADYFISNCANFDFMTPIDFCAPPEPLYYDSTAGVCAACGMIEIAGCLSEEDGLKYMEAAIKILKATDSRFCNYGKDEDSIVQMGSERYPVNGDMSGVHIPIIYGDFFFAEAILKLKGSKFLIW